MDAEFVAPRTDAEELVAEVFADILKIDKVGAFDNVHELGGNSLRGMRAVARICAEIEVDLPMRALFSHPVVADAGRWTRSSPRHESLRTTFPADEDGAPLAVVHHTVEVPLSIVDADGEDGAWRLVDQEPLRPFDLAAGPLLRPRLIRITEDCQGSQNSGTDQHILLLTMHHIVGDGWSVDVLLRDLIAGYRGTELPRCRSSTATSPTGRRSGWPGSRPRRGWATGVSGWPAWPRWSCRPTAPVR